jgi:20S proteasome alpha/beta subunit
MTIAGGFRCREGVLLCGDTELSTWSQKLQESKLFYGSCSAAKLGFAYAGHSDFAVSAIQNCKRRLQDTTEDDFLEELEDLLDHEYRRNVTNDQQDYQLLIAVKFTAAKVQLFVTNKTSMVHVLKYKCIGTGAEHADYLIRHSFREPMEVTPALFLAGYVLANVKEYIPGCGGDSQFLLLSDSGKAGKLIGGASNPFSGADGIAEDAKRHEELAQQLFLSAVNPGVKRPAFQKDLADFVERLEDVQQRWRERQAADEALARFTIIDE